LSAHFITLSFFADAFIARLTFLSFQLDSFKRRHFRYFIFAISHIYFRQAEGQRCRWLFAESGFFAATAMPPLRQPCQS